MTSRIQELAQAATTDILGVPVLDQQKFAELIVQECAGVVSDAVDHREPASTYVGKIKEHFGVDQ